MGFWSRVIEAVKGGNSMSASNLPDPNFNASMQMWTPGQPIWTQKNYASFVKNGYRRNPTVYACINKIAGAASGIDWKLYTDRTCEKTIDEHPLLDLWRKPNPSMPGSGSFIEQCFGFWHMAGNNYIYALRPNPNAGPIALWPLRPDRMKAVAGQGRIQNFVYGYESDSPKIYETAEILHMKFPGYDDDIYGLSPIEVAAYLADQQNEVLGWNTSLLQNAGRPSSVFFAKSILDEEQRDQIKAELKRKFSGKRNAGMPLVLEADMSWQSMSLTPAEMDFLKSYELDTRGIAAILDIAPELIGDSAGKTFANVAEARQALYLENVLPKLDRFRDYLASWLIPMYPDLVRRGAFFSYDKKDIEALQALYAQQKDAEHNRARQDFMAGGLMLNEYRDIIGQDDVDGGDCFRIGLVLVSEDSLEDYADQSLTAPATAPMPVAEGQPAPGSDPNAVPPGVHPQDAAALAAGQTGKKPAKGAKPPTDPIQPAIPATSTAKTPKPPKAPVQKKYLDPNGVYQPDDLEAQLAAYRAKGVAYLRWVTGKFPCDICIANDGHTVALGQPFPSGHILPPAHPNCDCAVEAAPEPNAKYIQAVLHETFEQFLERKGYKQYEQNSSMVGKPDMGYAPLSGYGSAMPVRPMPLEAQSSEPDSTTQETNDNGPYVANTPRYTPASINTPTSAGMTSKDVYRAFIERFT